MIATQCITSWNGADMWFMARSVYTTEYSMRPPFSSIFDWGTCVFVDG